MPGVKNPDQAPVERKSIRAPLAPFHFYLFLAEVYNDSSPLIADGGSCIAAPDGSWVIEPQVGEEGLYVAELDHSIVRKERQNFDPAGHYSRPDVAQLVVDRTRQTTVIFND